MRFSIRLNNDLPASEYPRLAQAAEAAGFHQFWVSDDLFLRSAPVLLTAVALATTRIELGTCIVNPYTMHPAEMAMMAATLDEVSGGRFNLGIAAGAGEFLKWVGITQEAPLAATVETIQAVNRLLAGEAAPMQGRFLRWTSQAYMRARPLRRVPIYLGAMGPNMLQAIGQYADGGLPLLLPPEHLETVLPLVRRGAELAGRSLDDIDLAACIWCSLADNQAEAEAPLRDKIVYYGHAMGPLIWERLGVTRADFDPIEHAVMVEQDAVKARGLVNERMLRIGVAGTVADLMPRVEALVAQGARHVSFGPPLGPDPAEAIATLGRSVIPHFKDR
ncbi:MAG: LLM class flavin-dependent oxidoreductase [Dehalococcoidia bacterium]|nr:LLM class flavin-dependent oxidoreductase [Dehalococcoidia bacterium]